MILEALPGRDVIGGAARVTANHAAVSRATGRGMRRRLEIDGPAHLARALAQAAPRIGLALRLPGP